MSQGTSDAEKDYRKVPLSRIKTLSAIELVEPGIIAAIGEEPIRRRLIERIGMELAAKLFEFNKVFIDAHGFRLIARIEVIVPTGPPDGNR